MFTCERPSTDTRPPILDLQAVSHRFGRTVAVDAVSLSIAMGEIVCLVGPSGCGKSTLLRIAAGLEDLQAGQVSMAGELVADGRASVAPERRGVGLVFQDYALFPHLSVLDNVRFGLVGQASDQQRQRAEEVLGQVGMADYLNAFPHTLSGGQQQRVALARALAPRPRLLLLDEPFSGLDARLRVTIRDQTLHVLKDSGAATLVVTHDPEEAMFLADRIALMHHGHLVQIGTPYELYCRPANAFAAEFFGEVNRLAGRVVDGHVSTALGTVPASNLTNNQDVDVLIRPESILVSLDPFQRDRVHGKIEAARLLGRTTLVHLSLLDEKQGKLHIHARVPGPFQPDPGASVSILLDPSHAFVFPRSREPGDRVDSVG